MSGIKVTIENEAAVRRALEQAGLDVQAVLVAAVMAGASFVAEEARQKAPGDGVAHELAKSTPKVVQAAVGPLKSKWFYRFAERGRGGGYVVRPRNAKALRIGERFARSARPSAMAARPFLRPAVDNNVDAIRNEVGRPIKAVLNG